MSKISRVMGHCDRCQGVLEFSVPQIGDTISCYHCGLPTRLDPLDLDEQLQTCELRASKKRWRFNPWLPVILGALAVAWHVCFFAAILVTSDKADLQQIFDTASKWLVAR